MAAPKIAELRGMSDAELMAAHDARAGAVELGIQYYIAELARRDEDRKTTAMLRYTKQIRFLTLVVTAATIIQLAIAYFH